MQKSKTIATSVLSTIVLTLPALVAAQTSVGTVGGGLLGTLALVSRLLNGLIGIAITLAIVVFFWGLIKYLMGGGAEGKSEGLKIMFYGVVTIFVMVSVWGLVQLLQSTFGVQGNVAPNLNTLRINTAI